MRISTRDGLDNAVVKIVCTIEEFGKKAYEEFSKGCINSCSKEIEDPVKIEDPVVLFSIMYSGKQPSRSDIEKNSVKNDVRIFLSFSL